MINDYVLYDSKNNDYQDTLVFEDVEVKNANHAQIFSIEHYGKLDDYTSCDEEGNILGDCALEILSLQLNNIEYSLTMLYNNPFIPEYSESNLLYAREHGITLNKELYNSLYFGFNGKYVVKFWTIESSRYFTNMLDIERNLHTEHHVNIPLKEQSDINHLVDLKKIVGLL